MPELQITGGAYQHASLATNNQRCLNMYPTVIGENGIGKATLLQRVGKKSLITIPGVTKIRGLIATNSNVYCVADNGFFQLDINLTTRTATSTLLGTINDFLGKVSMAANPNQIIIVNGTTSGWVYSPLTFASIVAGPIGNKPATGTVTPGTIGGSAGNTYTLTVNSVPIVTSFDVSTSPTVSDLALAINDNTSLTNVTATVAGAALTLTSTTNTITITESGVGFVAGTNGITKTGGAFSTGSIVVTSTYSLTLNGTAIYTSHDVSSGLSLATLITQINTLTGTTGCTAASGGSGVITLTNNSNANITVVESGTNFTAGTDGLTVTGQALSTGTVTTFSQITDANFLGGSSVVFLDGYFFLSQPGTNKFYASQLNNGLTYDGLDIAAAEINQSPIVQLSVKDRQLWIFKKDYIEVWYDAANNTGMPLSPRIGSEIAIGCGAANSVVNLNGTLFWFDNRGYIVNATPSTSVTNQTTGNVATPVSTDALNMEFASYSTVTDAIAIGYVERGHLMYQLNFPTEAKTWVLDVTTGEFHERSQYDSVRDTHQPDVAQIYCTFGGLNIVGGEATSGTLFISHPDYLDDNGSLIQAVRTTPHLITDFKLTEIAQLELKCNTGYSLVTGEGSTPYIMMRYSNDSGHTWSSQIFQSLGQIGEYGKRIQWNRLGTAMQWIFEFTVTAPINWAIVDASIQLGDTEQF